ncbi:MAG: hypothetical protein PF961_01140 [Planctomycetota bacterium]|jgi:uroporphyrinogen decarboxylase|nr:hypothetical protein [Planctomycetota bacterium]
MSTTTAFGLDPDTATRLRATAASLARESLNAEGMIELDCAQVWADQHQDAFKADRVVLGNLWSDECVFAELGIPEDWDRYHHDRAWLTGLCRQANDRAETIVGRRLLNQTAPDPAARTMPQPRQLWELFECRNVFEGDSYWMHPAIDDVSQLPALLDRVEARLDNLRAWLLPDNWDQARDAARARGERTPMYWHQRGPVTLATSMVGAESFLFLFYDDEALVRRLSAVMKRAMLAIRQLLEQEAGYTETDRPRGFSFADDNCCLVTPSQYELFAEPILETMWNYCSPDPSDSRYQHSDSAMAHLLPILGRLGCNGANFGPTIPLDQIRAHLPTAVIHGQVAPFTYSRDERENLAFEVLRDIHLAREARGLALTMAGSINNGSRLHGMRLIMATVQRHGWY